MESIQPSNVREVGFIDPDDANGVSTTLLEGDFQGLVVKGLQVGPYVVWWMPNESDQIGAFLMGAE